MFGKEKFVKPKFSSEPTAHMTLMSGDETPQKIDVYEAFPVLPTKESLRKNCRWHIEEDGAASEAQSDFIVCGVAFPDPDGEQNIYVRTECTGSRKVGYCALRVVQYNADGTKL